MVLFILEPIRQFLWYVTYEMWRMNYSIDIFLYNRENEKQNMFFHKIVKIDEMYYFKII